VPLHQYINMFVWEVKRSGCHDQVHLEETVQEMKAGGIMNRMRCSNHCYHSIGAREALGQQLPRRLLGTPLLELLALTGSTIPGCFHVLWLPRAAGVSLLPLQTYPSDLCYRLAMYLLYHISHILFLHRAILQYSSTLYIQHIYSIYTQYLNLQPQLSSHSCAPICLTPT
jgi:hypothetical protein